MNVREILRDLLRRVPSIPVRFRKPLRWVGYPLAYLGVFVFFCYVSFPYERLKQKVIAGYNAEQTGPDASRMEIESLEWSWRFPGIRGRGIRLVGPESAKSKEERNVERPEADAKGADDTEEGAEDVAGAAPPRGNAITLDDVYARVSPLSYLFGTTKLSFGGDAFGGSLGGSYSKSAEMLELSLELDGVDPAQLPELQKAVGLPLSGELTARVNLALAEGKASQANGDIELQIENFRVGDGKAKIRNTLALPELDVGILTLKATVVDGQLKIDTLTADGVDVQLESGGTIKLRDSLLSSIADLTLSFRFTDKYKTKNDLTKSLFGEPGSKAPGLFDLDPQIKRAKSDAGDYTWRIGGSLKNLRFTPAKGAKKGESAEPAREAGTSKPSSRSKSRSSVKRPRVPPTRAVPERASPSDDDAPPAAPIAPATLPAPANRTTPRFRGSAARAAAAAAAPTEEAVEPEQEEEEEEAPAEADEEEQEEEEAPPAEEAEETEESESEEAPPSDPAPPSDEAPAPSEDKEE